MMDGSDSKDNQTQLQVESLIDNAFSNASKNRALTKQEFNQAMKVFESFNTLNICNTHMASRLFEVLEEGRGRVDKE